MKRFLIALTAVVLAPATIVAVVPAQAMPVFDQANYSQNLLTAARTLQQIDQQIQQLQNEAKMLANMDKHLKRVDFPELELHLEGHEVLLDRRVIRELFLDDLHDLIERPLRRPNRAGDRPEENVLEDAHGCWSWVTGCWWRTCNP